MMSSPSGVAELQKRVWGGLIPLEIRLASSDCRTYDQSDPYLISSHRLSYYPLLLPRLHAFFSSFLIDPATPFYMGWLSYEGVALKWHYPLGLLHDLYSGVEPASADSSNESTEYIITSEARREGLAFPWKLTLHYTDWPSEHLIKLDSAEKILHDSFMNSIKEADFIRTGTARSVMSLSKDDSTLLWEAVREHDLSKYNSVNNKLLSPIGSFIRHIPTRIYIPSATISADHDEQVQGSVRVIQTLISPSLSPKQYQTLGTALHALLPSLFPLQRKALLAQPVLHGAIVPLTADIESLTKAAAYADGWLHIIILMIG